MKVKILILFSLVMFVFAVSLSNAGGIENKAVPFNPMSDLNQAAHDKPCPEVDKEKVTLEGFDFQLPYLLQKSQKSCLDKCTQEFDSCMSGTEGNLSGQFRCGEKKWMCTRGCDNQFAPQLEL